MFICVCISVSTKCGYFNVSSFQHISLNDQSLQLTTTPLQPRLSSLDHICTVRSDSHRSTPCHETTTHCHHPVNPRSIVVKDHLLCGVIMSPAVPVYPGVDGESVVCVFSINVEVVVVCVLRSTITIGHFNPHFRFWSS